MNTIWFFFASLFFTSCYTLEQGYRQVQLLRKQQPLVKVIANQKEPKDRLEKLSLVEPVLSFAKSEIGLTPGKSYQNYVSLDTPYVTWIVQAAQKNSLSLKTWWFPFLGEQPYLGYFRKEDAITEQNKLKNEGYDTVVRGVTAFSLLGYYPDPLYSSMLDHSTLPEFIETLFHESVHRTLYLPNFFSFNENLADFIAKRATQEYLRLNPNLGFSEELYLSNYNKNFIAQKKFQIFLIKVKSELNQFYKTLAEKHEKIDDKIFLAEREKKFSEISNQYKSFMNGIETGTLYEYAFEPKRINNAVILSYSIYESLQQPLEDALQLANGSLKQLIKNLKICLNPLPKNEKLLLSAVSTCKEKTSSE